MQIRKVKSSNGVITIRAEEQSGEDDVRRIELESRAEPRPEFHEAMGGLIGPAMRMIQAPLPWITVATISGLSITHEEERGIGAVVTILVPLECAPSPLVINTPYLISHLTGGPTLPDDLCQAIERVCDEATRYLNGDRAQGDLFAEHLAYDSGSFVERPGHVPVDKIFDGEMIYRALIKRDVEEQLEPAEYIAGKQVVGGPIKPPVGTQPAAEPEPQADGPILDQPPSEVAAEFERIRAEAMRKQPGIKPARGRRAAKEPTT